MFSGMIRKFSMLSLPFCVTIKVPVPSVADPGCLSRIPDPDFYPSRIPDLGSRIQKQQQKTGVKNFFCQTNFCSHKFHKTEYFFIFDKLNKKIWPNFPRIIEVFTQKIITKPSKIWVWDPGSGKNLFRIPDPGVKKAPDPGSGSATLPVPICNVADPGCLSRIFIFFHPGSLIRTVSIPDPHQRIEVF